MAATYQKLETSDGYMKGTSAGVSVQLGTKAKIKVKITLKAKTVSNVYKQLLKYKREFGSKTWEQIEKAQASGSMSFFYGLFDISAGGGYEYENQEVETNISDNVEAQRVAQALVETEETDVSLICTLE